MGAFRLHSPVYADLRLAVGTGVNNVLTSLHTERNQTTRPAPGVKEQLTKLHISMWFVSMCDDILLTCNYK